jgi:hypothetical protein
MNSYPFLQTPAATSGGADEVKNVLVELVAATAVEDEETPSLFPQDLESTNSILDMTLDYLFEELATNPDSPAPLSLVCVNIMGRAHVSVQEQLPGFYIVANCPDSGPDFLTSVPPLSR